MTNVAIHAEVHIVPIGAVHPNEYNPNQMSEAEFAHLVDDIRTYGFVGAIKVRADGAIVDGEHRWRAAKEIGMPEIPVTFYDCDELTARILTIRWDKEHGSFNPVRLAENLHHLGKHYGDQDLARLTGYREAEIQDFRRLLQLPPELREAVEAQAAADAEKVPAILHFVVTKAEADVVEAEVKRLAKSRRGDALVSMAQRSRAFDNLVDRLGDGEGAAGLESNSEERARGGDS